MSISETLSGSKNPKDVIAVTRVPLSLIPGTALSHCALAMHEGMLKYTKGNWRTQQIAAQTYVDAALRHIHRWIDGEQTAPDSGVHHLGHAMACLAILLDAQGSDKLIDNRPPQGHAGAALDRLPDIVRRLNERYLPDVKPAESVVDKLVSAAAASPEPFPLPESRIGREEYSIASESRGVVTHVVEPESDDSGWVDGVYLKGTAFTRIVNLYRLGYETIDDYLASQNLGG